jgi:hypothetical protein
MKLYTVVVHNLQMCMKEYGGVALTRYMDGRTDRVIPIYPPNFAFGGYNELLFTEDEQ